MTTDNLKKLHTYLGGEPKNIFNVCNYLFERVAPGDVVDPSDRPGEVDPPDKPDIGCQHEQTCLAALETSLEDLPILIGVKCVCQEHYDAILDWRIRNRI